MVPPVRASRQVGMRMGRVVPQLPAGMRRRDAATVEARREPGDGRMSADGKPSPAGRTPFATIGLGL